MKPRFCFKINNQIESIGYNKKGNECIVGARDAEGVRQRKREREREMRNRAEE